jgi:D-glycero-alpha-D-manno-heptose-7-phosphate kinase
MIICKTPFRISFFGGGTDIPDYYNKHNGLVIGTTINKYCYLLIRNQPKSFSYKHRFVWSLNEDFNFLKEIKNPITKKVYELLKPKSGLEIHHMSDLPSKSGMGSSSSFCVGLINGISSVQSKKITKEELYKSAIHVERKMLGESVGDQDSIFASYGGLRKIAFHKNKTRINKLKLNKEKINRLEENILLFNTNIERYASSVEKIKIKQLKNKITFYDKLKDCVLNAEKILESSNNEKDFGLLLNEYWNIKKSLSSGVSNDKINEIYKTALESGALGGKILGAGGGGFFMLYVLKKNQKKVIKSLNKLNYVKVKFSNKGSSIIKNIRGFND